MLLAPYRVLDLCDERGQLASQILAQLGADVVAVEPPGGARSRSLAPFAHDTPGPESSLVHLAYNRGKRSVVVDPSTDQGRAQLRVLLQSADVVIDDGPGGLLTKSGLSDADVAACNPALVHVSVTPFGLDGPKAGWAASDLVVWASGGPLSLTGDEDRPPVPVGVGQAWAHAAAEAAGAALLAVIERAQSGLGQRVDVSAQQCVGTATQSAILAAPNRASIHGRMAGGVKLGPTDLQLLWPCKDGHVSITLLFGSAIGPFSKRFMEWVHEEGFCDRALVDLDWIGYGALLLAGTVDPQEYEDIKALVGRFCMTKTKLELLEAALSRVLLVAPVLDVADVVHSAQFEARDYWDEVDGVRYPGMFAKVKGSVFPSLGASPKLGAHTNEVLGSAAARRPDAPVAQGGERRRPLEGVKVLDLSWVIAGPANARVLADYGAAVVKVESVKRIETARTIQPFCDDKPDTDTSVLYGSTNSGKLCMSLDLSAPESRAVVMDLVRWADVVVESFSPKALRNWGLSYEVFREANPSVIMLSSCLFGQYGPLASLAGFGTMAAALSGFFSVTGWPDRAPCGPYGAYTDYIAPRFSTALLLAALDHRRRTGEGLYIDFAQAEGALHALTPAVLEYTVNGHVRRPRGLHDDNHAPHGVYGCTAGGWVAVSCATDAQRAALAGVVGAAADDAIAVWTSQRTADEAMQALQAVGVAAHTVQNSPECFADPQMVHREHFLTFPHPATGTMTVEGPRAKLSATPGVVRRAGPTLGEHTMEVLTEILQYDDERLTELLVSGILE